MNQTNQKIPIEETGFEAEEQAEKNNEIITCRTCIYDNGTAVCRKRKKDHKKSLVHEYHPDDYCIDYKPNWKKIFPLMRQ